MHLLVLDDERGISALLSMVARDRGWSAETSVSESEFQQSFHTDRPDTIILDLQLNQTDGVEQLRFLGQQNYTGSVVLISGFDPRVLASAEEIGRGLGLSIVATMHKPIRIADLRALLEKIEQSSTFMHAPKMEKTPIPSSTPEDIDPNSIIKALEAGELELYLQPIISATDQSITKLEGLARWHHPKHGLLLPDIFIPIAEQDGLAIDMLTMWAIKTAARLSGELTLEGFVTVIGVNISGVSLHSLDFPDRVEALIEENMAPRDAVSFELTETVAMQNPPAVADILTRLRLKGFALALDDFGTGYSSLKTLRQMPFSAIKIDQSFVHDMTRSAESMAIVKSVIALAQSMEIESVAEGVEDDETAEALIKLGVTSLQGDYYCPASPFAKLITWLKAWTSQADTGGNQSG